MIGSHLNPLPAIGLAQRRRALMRRLDLNYQSFRIFATEDAPDDRESSCALSDNADCNMRRIQPVDQPVGGYWRIQSQKKNFLRGSDDAFKAYVKERESEWYGYSDSGEDDIVSNYIANIRTDLDSFTTAESAILENHGYYMVDIAIRIHASDLGNWANTFRAPNPGYIDENQVRKYLKHRGSIWWFWTRWLDK